MANLLGRADATLVKAATDAAMANVPVDVSRIHERMMRSHERTMKSIGQSWVQGITGAMQIGGALVKQAQQNRKQLDAPHKNYTDYEPLPETKEVISPPFEGGEEPAIIKQPTFKEWFIENNLKPENTGKSQSELKAQYDKENISVSTEEESSIVEYKHTDITGNTEIVKPKTIREHLKGIRKEYVSLGWRGDKDAINPATGIEWTKEDKKVRRDELKGKRDKLKASVVEFQTYSAVMKQQLADNNINQVASDPVKMQFARALSSEGKPLEDGSRAIMGFGDEGNMTFTYVDKYGRPIMGKDGKQLSLQQANIGDLLVLKNPEARGNHDIVGSSDLHFKTGKAGKDFDENGIASFVENGVIDGNAFKDLSNYLGPNVSQTLASALHGVTYNKKTLEPEFGTTEMSEAFFGELNKLGDLDTWDIAGGTDGGGDGQITAQDFTNPANYKLLTDYVLSGEDLNLSKKILETHLVNEAKNYYNDGLEQFKIDNESKNAGLGIFELPWGSFPLPKDSQGREDRAFAQSVADGSKTVTKGEDTFVLNSTGKYEQTRGKPYQGEEQLSAGEFTRTQLIQQYGGLYKNIPNKFYDEESGITDYLITDISVNSADDF